MHSTIELWKFIKCFDLFKVLSYRPALGVGTMEVGAGMIAI